MSKSKTENIANEISDGEDVGVVTSKHKKPVKKARFQADSVVPRTSRHVSEEVVESLEQGTYLYLIPVMMNMANDEDFQLRECKDSNLGNGGWTDWMSTAKFCFW